MLRQASYIGDGTLLHEQKQKKENILSIDVPSHLYPPVHKTDNTSDCHL